MPARCLREGASPLGRTVRQTLIFESKPRELEQHNQKPNDGGLPLGAAFQPFVFVQY
jgi:hypothetical protein